MYGIMVDLELSRCLFESRRWVYHMHSSEDAIITFKKLSAIDCGPESSISTWDGILPVTALSLLGQTSSGRTRRQSCNGEGQDWTSEFLTTKECIVAALIYHLQTTINLTQYV